MADTPSRTVSLARRLTTHALGALWAVNALVAPVPRASAEEVVDAKSIDRWIQGLGSESFIQRDFAIRKLRRLGESIVPRLEDVARTGNQPASDAAIRLIEQMALHDDATAATAHRALASLHGDDSGLSVSLAETVAEALRSADRRVVGIITALGGSIGRDQDSNITSLQIRDARFGDEQARILVRIVSLTELHLRDTRVTDQSLKSIAKLPALEVLNLSDTNVTADGLRELAPLRRLKKLVLYRIEITEADRRWFRERLPDCILQFDSSISQ